MFVFYSVAFLLIGVQTFWSVDARNYKRDADDNGYRAPPAAILTHKQAVTNDGTFNYVFAADNGLKQGESISPDGTRTGAYQYIDPSGKTISVKYVAGKDGFRIIEGDHIPLQPQQVKPIPEYQPPEYREKLEKESFNQKYKTPVKNYNKYPQENSKYVDEPRYKSDQADYQQEQPKYRQEKTWQKQEQPRYQQDRNQQQNSQKNLFNPNQNGGQRPSGGYQKNEPQQIRSMLYDLEQRHDVNYRKYLDNGQAADGQSDNQQAAPHFGGGYNFEIKG